MRIHYGDCLEVMSGMEADSIDLIVTSPPYADARKHTYGGVAPDDYVEWFLPRARQIKRIMKPSGSFILNIKEKCEYGERHIYVLKLILALKEDLGFRWVEEYIWHKINPMPGKWKYRFKDGWERLLHFTKTQDFKMFQDAVMVEFSDTFHEKIKNGVDMYCEARLQRYTGSGFRSRMENWHNRDKAYPSNVLQQYTSDKKSHSATFPDTIPEFFIRLFTDEGDTVLDPFLGSGTTCKVAEKLNRKSIGIEILQEYQHLHEPDQQMRLI